MTVATTTNKVIGTGNGVTTVFPFSFPTLPTGDLVVSLFDLDGVEITQTEITDYEVSGKGEAEGSVEFVDAVQNGYTVLIMRIVPYLQPTDFKNQGSFYPKTHESTFDRIVMLTQQLDERVSAAITLPPQVQGVSTQLPAPNAAALLGWNEDANAITNYTLASLATSIAYGSKSHDIFIGDGVDVTFNLSSDPGSLSNLDVSIDGVTQVPSNDYSYSGTLLTFTDAPADGAVVFVRFDQALPTGVTLGSAVNFNDPVAPTYLKTLSDIANGEPINLLRNVSPSKWDAIRQGVNTDDLSSNMLDLLDAMGTAKRAHLIIPYGVINIENVLEIVNPPTIDSFRITGEDWANSIIRRNSDFAGSVFNISGLSNFVMENFRIDGGHDMFPNGNHGFSISNGSHIRCRNLQIINYKNTAGLIFQFPNDTLPLTTEDNVIEGCVANGNGVANNGFLIGDGQYSGIRDCLVKDLGQSGSPQYALQIKGISHRCFITGSIAINARAGIAFGQETVAAEAVTDSIIANCIVRDCVWGIYAGLANRNTISNVSIDMNNLGSSAIELADCIGNTIEARIYRARDAVGVAAAEFTGTSSDNHVRLREFHQSGTGIRAAIFEAGTERNTVELDRYVGTGTITRSQQMVVDSSVNSTNIFDFKRGPNSDVQVISGGSIRVAHSRIDSIRVDTEGGAATDDLVSINGPGVDGQTITLYTVNNGRDVVNKHAAIGTGGSTIFTKTAADVTLGNIAASIMIRYDASLVMWCEV